jgi:YVTN family beta-propeller protein
MVPDGDRAMSLGFAPGTTFGGYRIESIAGRGGMGLVLRAFDLSLQRPVALKLIAPELADDEAFRRRFLRESRLAASLDHPNVVPIHDAGEHDGQLYLAMRLVEGTDLRTLLKRERRLAPERALALLAQIADALDAAHRGGLVHRDVKPANVLVDADDHAYLTDFGVSKQVGADATVTGPLVGTLDYLAPEQIRGEALDARADVYAFTCVLYHCLAGVAPFHRRTEAQTLWAHMHEQVAALPQHPALTPVLRKGLAKSPDRRYETCGGLMTEARAAFARGRARRRPLQRRYVIAATGLLVLTATIFAFRIGSDDPPTPPVGNGIAAVGADGRLASFTEIGAAPSNIAVGEGSVWVLNTEADTISRIDPGTGKVVKVSRAGERPSDLAVGAGALWVGHGGGLRNVTARVSRVDPDSGAIVRTVRLPVGNGDGAGPPSTGYPRVAVGAGAVWASNPDETVSRIDPETGRLLETIDVGVPQSTIAAGAEGVWFLNWENRTVTSIDPRTNRIGEEIPVDSAFLQAIAVGAGSVWVTSPQDGRLWRIDPGRSSTARSIQLEVGAGYLAFGDGAVWVANYRNGTVSRIDPRTNAVTARVRVGAAQALVAGAGAAWVSTAAGAKNGRLPAANCSAVASAGQDPDVLVASDLPLQGREGAAPRASADAIRFVLNEHGFRAGRHLVGYQSCDNSTAQTGDYEQRRCAANANAYARADRLVGVIGPFNSFCAQAQIAILNHAPGGPLAMMTPSASFTNFTRARFAPPEQGLRGEPDVHYPTGERNFFRVTSRDDHLESAAAVLAKRLDLDSVYLLRDRADALAATSEQAFRWAAAQLGVEVAGSVTFDGTRERYDAVAARAARSGADGVVIYGNVFSGGDRLIKALRARLGRPVPIMLSEFFGRVSDIVELAGPAARGTYMTALAIPPEAVQNPAVEHFTREFGEAAHATYALQAAQATEVLLQAIARSDGTRASVLRQIRATRVDDGLLGSLRFDRNGDMRPARVVVLRITGTAPATVRLPGQFHGAVVDRLMTLPASLEGRPGAE